MKQKFSDYMILSDMDGTLLNAKKEISEENKKAVKYFCDNGGIFSICSGRSAEFINRYRYIFNAPVISTNGTMIYDFLNNKIIHEFRMNKECFNIAFEILKIFHVIRISVFSDNEIFIENPTIEKIKEISNLEIIYKIVFVFENSNDALLAKSYLSENYGDKYSFDRSWGTGLELHSKGSGKGECIKYLNKVTKRKFVIGVGDFENDISLLKYADISIAPSNALDCVKELADMIVCDNENSIMVDIIAYIEKKIEMGK